MYTSGVVSLSSNQGEGNPKYLPLVALLGSLTVLYGVTRYLRKRNPSFRSEKSESLDSSNYPETKIGFRREMWKGILRNRERELKNEKDPLKKVGIQEEIERIKAKLNEPRYKC